MLPPRAVYEDDEEDDMSVTTPTPPAPAAPAPPAAVGMSASPPQRSNQNESSSESSDSDDDDSNNNNNNNNNRGNAAAGGDDGVGLVAVVGENENGYTRQQQDHIDRASRRRGRFVLKLAAAMSLCLLDHLRRAAELSSGMPYLWGHEPFGQASIKYNNYNPEDTTLLAAEGRWKDMFGRRVQEDPKRGFVSCWKELQPFFKEAIEKYNASRKMVGSASPKEMSILPADRVMQAAFMAEVYTSVLKILRKPQTDSNDLRMGRGTMHMEESVIDEDDDEDENEENDCCNADGIRTRRKKRQPPTARNGWVSVTSLYTRLIALFKERETFEMEFFDCINLLNTLMEIDDKLGLAVFLLRLDVFCKLQCQVVHVNDTTKEVFMRVLWQHSDIMMTARAQQDLPTTTLRTAMSPAFSASQQQQRQRAVSADELVDNCVFYDFVEDVEAWRREAMRAGGRICPFYRPFLVLIPEHMVRMCISGDDTSFRDMLRDLGGGEDATAVYTEITAIYPNNELHRVAMQANKVTHKSRFVPASNTFIGQHRLSVVRVQSPLGDHAISDSLDSCGAPASKLSTTTTTTSAVSNVDLDQLPLYTILIPIAVMQPPTVGPSSALSTGMSVVRSKALYPATLQLSVEDDETAFTFSVTTVSVKYDEEEDMAEDADGAEAKPSASIQPELLKVTVANCEGLMSTDNLQCAQLSDVTTIPYPLETVEATIDALCELHRRRQEQCGKEWLRRGLSHLRSIMNANRALSHDAKVENLRVEVAASWTTEAENVCAVPSYSLLVPSPTLDLGTLAVSAAAAPGCAAPTRYSGGRKAITTLRCGLKSKRWEDLMLTGVDACTGSSGEFGIFTDPQLLPPANNSNNNNNNNNNSIRLKLFMDKKKAAVTGPILVENNSSLPVHLTNNNDPMFTPANTTESGLFLCNTNNNNNNANPVFMPVHGERWCISGCWSADMLVDWLLLPPLEECIYISFPRTSDQGKILITAIRDRMKLVLTDNAVMERDEFLGDALVDYIIAMRKLRPMDARGIPRWRGGPIVSATSNIKMSSNLPRPLCDFLKRANGAAKPKHLADVVEALFGALATVLWVEPRKRGGDKKDDIPFEVLYECGEVLCAILKLG